MLEVRIDSFSYDNFPVLKDISFKVHPGEHLSILGSSGSGKSTLLHLTYGLLPLENGQIFYNGQLLKGLKGALIPGEKFMKLVAQDFNLMPYATVAENIGSFLSRIDYEEDERRIDELLEVVDLGFYKNTKVRDLSGGQKQRVELAKALAKEPEILLLDEPFSNMDLKKKKKLSRSLFPYLKTKKISCIVATHDADEALAFADSILMLRAGRVEKYDTTEEFYLSLSNLYQASFFDDAALLPENILKKTDSRREVIVFPYRLSATKETTALEVAVESSFFKGNYYRIIGRWKEKEIYFDHHESIPSGTRLFLEYLSD